ncbi:MAG: hypothetical protein ACYTHN_23690, partial [Planctomycetota bacterium]
MERKPRNAIQRLTILPLPMFLFLGGLLAQPLPAETSDRDARLREISRGLQSPSWEERNRATERLIEYGDVALPTLFRLLTAPDVEVRTRADWVIRAARESPLLLREAFRNGPPGAAWAFRVAREVGARNPASRDVHRIAVIRAAGLYGGPECARPLAICVAEGHREAAEALALLGAPKACTAAARSLYRPSLAQAILPAVGKIGGREAEAFLKERIRKGDAAEQLIARESLKACRNVRRASLFAQGLLSGNRLQRREIRRALGEAPPEFRCRVVDGILRRGKDHDSKTLLACLDRPWVWTGVPPALLSFRRGKGLVEAWIASLPGRDAGRGRAWVLQVLAEYPGNPRAVEAVAAAVFRSGGASETAAFGKLGGYGPPCLAEWILRNP